MANRRTHDVVATVGNYEKNGEKKKRFANVGSAFTDEEGRVSIKLDSVPVSPEWSGWLSLYPIEKSEQRRPARPAGNSVTDDPEDIPF